MKVSKLQELVPLYINGAMSENDRRVFAQALKQNATLKQEYLEFYELDSVISSADSVDALQLDHLYKNISIKPPAQTAKHPQKEAAPKPKPLPNLSNTQEITKTVERDFQDYDDENYPEKYSKEYFLYVLSSPKVAWAIIGMQFLLLSLLAVLKFPHTLPSNGEKTETNMINVVFADNATQKDIRELLVNTKAQIANGPTDIGLYTIYIRTSAKQAELVIDNLKKSKLILLAEPAFAGKK